MTWQRELLAASIVTALTLAAGGCAGRAPGSQPTTCEAPDAKGCSRFAEDTRKRWKREQATRDEESRRNAFVAGDRPSNSSGR